MPFPRIHSCVVSEGVRPEVLRKLTIFGFFGVAPNVHVVVGDFAQPVTLYFLFVGGAGAGYFRANIRVVAPNGRAFVGVSDAVGEFAPDMFVCYVGIGFQAQLPGPGEYAITLTADGRDQYSTTMELHQGNQERMLQSVRS
jgi:hypothetical protein